MCVCVCVCVYKCVCKCVCVCVCVCVCDAMCQVMKIERQAAAAGIGTFQVADAGKTQVHRTKLVSPCV